MKNQIGFCEWIFSVNGPFAIQIASEIGFSGMQLGDLGGETKQFPMNNKRVQQGYLEAAEKYNVQLHSMHLFSLVREGTMVFPAKSDKGIRAIESIAKGIDACYAMGIHTLMLSAFFATEIKTTEQFSNYIEILKHACNLGKDKNVRIVFEGVLHIDQFLRMKELVGDELKFCYDTGNPIRWKSGEPAEEIRKLGLDNIDHVHVKDLPADRVGYCLLGDGIGQFDHTFSFLNELGYDGWYITENNYEQPPMGIGADFIELAKKDLSYLRQLIKK